MSFWNEFFAYDLNDGKLHYLFSYAGFLFNSTQEQLNEFQDLRKRMTNEEALSAIYHRIRNREIKEEQNQYRLQSDKQRVTDDRFIWNTNSFQDADLAKEEYKTETKRWLSRGIPLEQHEFKRKIIKSREPSQKILLQEPVVKAFQLDDIFYIKIHDKINGCYTAEYVDEFHNENNCFITRHKNLYDIMPMLKRFAARFRPDVESRLNKRREKEQLVNKQKEEYKKYQKVVNQSNLYQTFFDMQDIASVKPKTKQEKKPRHSIDHVQAAMGQNINIDAALMDDNLF